MTRHHTAVLHRTSGKRSIKLQKSGQAAVLLLPATIPLLFGAVHPVVLGLYTAYMLIAFGGWLLVNSSRLPQYLYRSRWIYVTLFFIGWLVFTTIPLPMAMLEVLSPTRAASLLAVNELSGTAITWAPLNYYSSAGLLTAVFLFSLLLYARTLDVLLSADPSLLAKLLYTCIGLGIFEAAYGMLQVFNPNLGVLWLSDVQSFKGMARGTIIYKNQYASLLNMCWPLAIGAALLQLKKISPLPTRRHKRTFSHALAERLTPEFLLGFFLLFLASFMVMVVLFSQSRGGTLAIGVIMLLMLFLLPLARKNKIQLTSGLLFFSVFYGSVVGFSSVITRFLQIGDSGLARINLYLASLPMLQDHLTTGIGIESFELLSPIYLKHFPEHILYSRAHNEYLELAIELGVPMAIFLFTALFTAVLIQAKKLSSYRAATLSTVPSPVLIGIVSLCAIAGFLFHGLADFGWHLPANIVYAVTLIVLINHGIRRFHDRYPPAVVGHHGKE